MTKPIVTTGLRFELPVLPAFGPSANVEAEAGDWLVCVKPELENLAAGIVFTTYRVDVRLDVGVGSARRSQVYRVPQQGWVGRVAADSLRVSVAKAPALSFAVPCFVSIQNGGTWSWSSVETLLVPNQSTTTPQPIPAFASSFRMVGSTYPGNDQRIQFRDGAGTLIASFEDDTRPTGFPLPIPQGSAVWEFSNINATTRNQTVEWLCGETGRL